MGQVANSRDIITSFLKAINDLDFKAVRSYVSDNLLFVGALGTRDGAEAYVRDMEKMHLRYDVKKVFSDGDDVCVWYEIDFGKAPPIMTSGWYKVKDGKISSIRVVFDPRPLLPPPQK